MPTLVEGSRFPVGSSAISSIGRLAKARAIATRCCSPPDSSSGRRPSLPARPTSSRTSGTDLGDGVPRLADHLEGEGDVLEDGLVGQQAEVLEDGAHLPSQRRDLPAGQPVEVLAEDVHGPGGRALLAQHQPQQRRLAGAGGADEEDELTLLDLEGAVLDRRPGLGRVQLGDVVESDHGGAAGVGGRTGCARARAAEQSTSTQRRSRTHAGRSHPLGGPPPGRRPWRPSTAWSGLSVAPRRPRESRPCADEDAAEAEQGERQDQCGRRRRRRRCARACSPLTLVDGEAVPVCAASRSTG